MKMSSLSDNSKKALIANLFDKSTDDIDLRDYQDYFRVIDDEIQFLNDYETFQSNNFKLHPNQLNQIALEVVQELKINPGAKQAAIIQKLYDKRLPQIHAQGETKGKALLEYILDGTIRIWIMVDTAGSSEPGDYGWRGERKFCDFVHGIFYPGQSAPAYPDNKETSVRDSELMAELKAEMASENTQIQSSLTHPLTAANMKKLTNITTHWANGLNQHLQFDADFRNLSVFPHNRWLFDALDMVHKWRQDNTPLPLENETEGQTELEQPPMK
ncbi:hypothetical protein FCIRC_10012 [Fusarium circinatum]|uniref:Uncharacterized protein n=1 Tax=Fusarium circinatum TaxID=48490 RepID=A0A8H5WQT2_FUSCI|nr:hypothetical protein FCIRC_10012 [Fusarium circinatum]